MSYFAKQKVCYYRRYQLDIWGFIKNTLQVFRDNTLYKVYRLGKCYIWLQKLIKKTTWEYKKYKKLFEMQKFKKKVDKRKRFNINKNNKLKDNTVDTVDIEKLFKKKLKSRYKWITRLITISNLIKNFIKATVSVRVSKMVREMVGSIKGKRKTYIHTPFIYEPRIPAGIKKRRRLKYELLSFRVIRLFYVMYTYKQLKKIGKKAKLQSGVFEQNYLVIIESKLPSYLYRTSFFPTLFESLDFVKQSNVWINKKYKPFVYYSVKLFDIVGFRPFYKSYVLWSFFKRLKRKAFMFLFSRCMYVSLTFLITLFIARFTINDMINSFEFDYYRVINYAQ